MANPTGRRFINIKDFTIGTTQYNTIKSVDYDESAKRIMDSGDNDKYVSFQVAGVSDCSVTITLSDPVQAQAISRAIEGDITFNGVPEDGGVEKTVKITKFKSFGRSGKNAHDAINSYTIKGNARSSNGILPIVEESLAA